MVQPIGFLKWGVSEIVSFDVKLQSVRHLPHVLWYSPVLVKHEGAIIGAVGITGDNSDNDEACAIAAITKVGFIADGG